MKDARRWIGSRTGLAAAIVAALAAGAPHPAAGQETRDVFPFPVTTFELENGLRVVGVDYDSPGIVAYYTVVRTGSRNEVEPGFSGYAHFFEHMMFRGTDKYSTEAYNAVVKSIGADANAFTTSDWTAYYTVASSDALETIMDLESDRFQRLRYSEDDFRTEAGAILGEYNLNFSNPVSLLRERLYDLAYTTHPYKHTTIGLLDDIRDMPNHYDYSLEFYDRYYRPENCFLVVVGDFDAAELERLARRYYGGWERGGFVPDIPAEPRQTEARSARVTWPNPTLPFLMMGYHAPAFSDRRIDMPALDVLSQVLFSETSPLFRKLYLEEQVVDAIQGGALDSRDAPLFTIIARITDPEKVDYVRDAIVAEIERLKSDPVDAEVLAATKSHMRYAFAMGLDNPGGIARTLGHYLQLTGDPETVNRVYALYDAVTPDDVMAVARAYFGEANRSVVILTPEEEQP
ncbi:MAG: pitrilysin family protein [Acidobacteria bacterium]|nr:pitrilysin family protein [Acidobacteriota bacterium]